MTKVGKMQTDTTYSVDIDGNLYTVTIMEDHGSKDLQWEIFDADSKTVTDAEVIEPIVYVIEALRSEENLKLCQCSNN